MYRSFSDLVLLVGTNPLPNYVVASYFLHQNLDGIRRIWLLYSEETRFQSGTEELAKNLKDVLARTNPAFTGQFFLKSLSDVGNAKQISSDITRKLLNPLRQLDFTGIHLNYTGGTKAMAVHIYRGIESYFPNEASFSYLDARDYKIKDDYEGAITGDLRLEIKIDFEDLIKLHGYERASTNEKLPPPEIISKTMHCIDEIINRTGNAEVYIDFFCRGIYPKDSAIRQLIEPITAYKREYKKFMQGLWLEYYTASKIQQIINQNPRLKKRTNLYVESNVNLKKDGKKLELDVVVLNGYQVSGISCTAKHKEEEVKQKGFEVIHRVHQIGGEESKAVVVSGLRGEQINGAFYSEQERVRRVKADLGTITGSTERLEVLGVSDHLHLDSILLGFIWGEEA